MLCGIQGLYIAMNFLKPNTQSYKQILDRFKDISPKGTSLNELKKFISEESDFFSYLSLCNEEDIARFDRNMLALVLLEGTPVSHIVVMRPITNGIQIIDPPFDLRTKIKRNDIFEQQQRPVLIISTKQIPASVFQKIRDFFLVSIFLLSCFWLIKAIRMERRKKSEKI